MDTAECEGAEALAENVDLLVAESTFSDDDAGLAAEYLHLTAGQAGTLAANGHARTLVLTHFSSRYPDVGVLKDQATAAVVVGSGATSGTQIIAANDLDRIPLPKRRSLP